jgi:16S rRNA (guanine966-N2)-methyltransferase
MRVIGGRLRGQRIDAPVGMATRPTLDRVREALFNVLQAVVPDARVLDLYAGSGALAIEALSRGARSAVLVERSGAARRVIRDNLRRLELLQAVRLLGVPAECAVMDLEPSAFDLAFLDPPWPTGIHRRVVERMPVLLAEKGMVVVEHEADRQVETLGVDLWPGLSLVDRRRYGRTGLSLFTRTEEQA